MVILTSLAVALMVGTTAASVDGACGGGWGEWSVPINTLLLVVLAVINLRTRVRVERKVGKVQAVTDKVKLRRGDKGDDEHPVDIEP